MVLIGLFAFDGLPSVSAQADTTAPTVSSVGITSDTEDGESHFDDDGVYGIGDAIKVTVTFSEDVTVTGAPQLELDIGGTPQTAVYESSDGSAVVFAYTVAENDSDDNGIAINANKLTLNGGSIRDSANNDADLTHEEVTAQENQRVDGIRPTVSSVSMVLSTGGRLDGVYISGETLVAQAIFSEDIIVTGTPQLELNLEGTGKSADFEYAVPECEQMVGLCLFSAGPLSVRGIRMVFDYSVAEGDSDEDGVGIDANAISLNGGTIKDAAGNDAVLTHSAAAESSSHLVDGSRSIGGL